MRFLMMAVACLALAGCGGSTSGGGKSLAIKFDQIKAGTTFVYQNTDNRSQWIRRYEGIENGLHVIRGYSLDRNGKIVRHLHTHYYDTLGRRTRIDNPGFDHTFVFSPYDCNTGTTGTCSHQRTLFDSQTGARKLQVIKHFEFSLSGDTLKVVENAKGNRLRRTNTLNEVNVLTSQREPNPQFANNWDLVQTIVPSN